MRCLAVAIKDRDGFDLEQVLGGGEARDLDEGAYRIVAGEEPGAYLSEIVPPVAAQVNPGAAPPGR